MSEPSLRRMTAMDVVRIVKVAVPKFYGVVAVLNGKDIGSAVIVWGDKERFYLCLEITDALREKPVFMFKVAKSLVKAGVAATGELYAIEQADEPTAPKLLERLGFKPTDELANGERVLKIWQH